MTVKRTRNVLSGDIGEDRPPGHAYYDQSWALVIGINEYGGGFPRLANARSDAAAMAGMLEETYGFHHVFTLFDADASRDAITKWLRDTLPDRVGPRDRLVIFFAGHGISRKGPEGQERGYLIPHDATEPLYSKYIDMSELLVACGWIKAKHILIILDCCFSGIAAITARSISPARQSVMTDVYIQKITERSAWQVLTAGTTDQLAADGGGGREGHSPFTSAVLAGLEGQADHNRDGIITAIDLAVWVRPEVGRQDSGGAVQTPFFNYLAGSGQGDFVFLRPGQPIDLQAASPIERLRAAPDGMRWIVFALVAAVVALGMITGYMKKELTERDQELYAIRRSNLEGQLTQAAILTDVANQETSVAVTRAPGSTRTAVVVARATGASLSSSASVATLSAFTMADALKPNENATRGPIPNPEVNLNVPFVHQLWDTPSDFDGSWAVGPAVTTMLLAYYGALEPRPITLERPVEHVSAYGWYVSNPFTYAGRTFDAFAPTPRGQRAQGLYGAVLRPLCGGSWCASAPEIQSVLDLFLGARGLRARYESRSDDAQETIKASLRNGHPVIASGKLFGWSHLVIIRGFEQDGGMTRWIVNDSYGYRTDRSFDGGNVVYDWSDINLRWLVRMEGASQ